MRRAGMIQLFHDSFVRNGPDGVAGEVEEFAGFPGWVGSSIVKGNHRMPPCQDPRHGELWASFPSPDGDPRGEGKLAVELQLPPSRLLTF
jgi:hypothetical protein